MVVFPNCKINLGLHVIAKRPDGFHELETVFYPIGIQDALEIITVDNGLNDVQLTISGESIPGSHDDNICVKAWRLLKKDFPSLPPVAIHLHKVVPIGAGLGGGSSDGAFTLTTLNKKYALGISTEKLLHYALQLGSDCPFFIKNTPSFAGGRGEVFREISISLKEYRITLVHPGIRISTAWAFSQITPKSGRSSLQETFSGSIQDWKNKLVNDFEEAVFITHPSIRAIKEELYQKGAVYASMSGSGSSVYGIFKKDSKPSFSFPQNYFVRHI